MDDDVIEEDTVSMPYQASVQGSRPDDNDSFVGSYDSTHFDRRQHGTPHRLLGNGSVQVVTADVSINSGPNDLYQASA